MSSGNGRQNFAGQITEDAPALDMQRSLSDAQQDGVDSSRSDVSEVTLSSLQGMLLTSLIIDWS